MEGKSCWLAVLKMNKEKSEERRIQNNEIDKENWKLKTENWQFRMWMRMRTVEFSMFLNDISISIK